MKAIYTNGTDYLETKREKVRIVGYVFGATENRSRSHGQHPPQPLAICVSADGKLFHARLEQLHFPTYRVPWWIIRDKWRLFRAWLARQTPAARARAHGHRFVYNTLFDQDKPWECPTLEELENFIEGHRHERSKNFVKGMESVLNEYPYSQERNKISL